MSNSIDAGCNMVYIAMYDEVDEGTAIFKLTENDRQTPSEGKFVTLDMDGYELPGDWYLRLTGAGSRMLRGEIPVTSGIPIVPFPENAEFMSQETPTVMSPGATVSVSVTMKNTGVSTWTKADSFMLGYSILPDSNVWGINHIELSPAETIAPDENKTFTFDITAPGTEGVYYFQWRMISDSVGWFGESSELRLVNVGNSVKLLDDCDALTDWEPSARLSLNSSDKKQGTSSIEFTGGINDTVEFQKVFSSPYNSGVTAHDAVLQFWYYASDASQMGTGIQIEIGSGRTDNTDI